MATACGDVASGVFFGPLQYTCTVFSGDLQLDIVQHYKVLVTSAWLQEHDRYFTLWQQTAESAVEYLWEEMKQHDYEIRQDCVML